MIDFPCRCGHVFHVDQTLAGEPMQCPDCRKLVIVPTTSDLAEWEGDGTYRVGDPDIKPEPGRIGELYRNFTRSGVDEAGQSIDNRQSLYDPNAPPIDKDPTTIPPRYDPETGERVRELDIKPPVEPVVHATGAVPVISASLPYATPEFGDPHAAPRVFNVLLQLFMPVNAAVMFFVLIFHILVVLLASCATMVLLVVGVPSITLLTAALFLCALLGHWMNVIEEIGPIDRDELPSLFRSFNIIDDIWRPGRRAVSALLIAFGPALVAALFASDTQPGRALALILFAAGILFYPAIAITIVCGELADLRPDRLFGMIGACGISYFTLIFSFVLATAFYCLGLVFSQFIPIWLGIPFLKQFGKFGIPFGISFLIIGIYLMHWFCWSAGLVYRKRHDNFPWTWQGYFKDRPASTLPPPNQKIRPPQKNRPRPAPNPAALRLPPVAPLSIPQTPVHGFPVIPLPADQPPQIPLPVEPLDVHHSDPHRR